jgi:BirA family biotin operon repressor/biotin-[acetyl-CoA-carboxylase] ligase
LQQQPVLPAGYRLLAFDRVDSTNQIARNEAMRGAPHGTVVWAHEQSAGRGRYGRGYVSLPGNLFVSFILRPGRAARDSAQLGFVAGVALAEAVEPFCPAAEIRLKWPNDLMLGDRKAAGILLETQAFGRAAPVWVVLGVGVNVATAPEGRGFAATSLAERGAAASVSAATVLSGFADRFDCWYRRWLEEGFAVVRNAWLDRAFGLGAPITVRLADTTMEGTFRGLDDEGALVLAAETGSLRTIGAGDVYFPGTA